MKLQVYFTAGLVHVSTVVAWGAVGHEIVADIAQIYLHNTTTAKLCALLPTYADCHLAPIAAWADKVRPFFRWSSHMHYIGDVSDHPGDHCAFGTGEWEDPEANVLQAVRNTSAWLQQNKPGGEEALKFLVHFMGDLHMPLHLTGRDRGGNDMKVRFDGRLTNLHSVWDSRMIAKTLRTLPYNYTRPLPVPRVESVLRGTIYDPYIRQIVWEGLMSRWKNDLFDWLSCTSPVSVNPTHQQAPLNNEQNIVRINKDIICPDHWAKPIHALNCELIWPPELDQNRSASISESKYLELDTPGYAGRIKNEFIIEKLFAAAGIRLAGILNYLLDSGEAQELTVSQL